MKKAKQQFMNEFKQKVLEPLGIEGGNIKCDMEKDILDYISAMVMFTKNEVTIEACMNLFSSGVQIESVIIRNEFEGDI